MVNNFGTALNDHWYGIDVAAGRDVADIPTGTVDVFGFSGGAALLRTDAVKAVGGFPAQYFIYYEDLDTSWRLRLRGWVIRAVPTARVVHRHAVTSDPRSAMFHFHNERNRLLTAHPLRTRPGLAEPIHALPADHWVALVEKAHRPGRAGRAELPDRSPTAGRSRRCPARTAGVRAPRRDPAGPVTVDTTRIANRETSRAMTTARTPRPGQAPNRAGWHARNPHLVCAECPPSPVCSSSSQRGTR